MSATSYNSLAEAGNAAGVNKSTILKAIRSGLISATRTETGGWQIEPAELHRVFAPVAAATVSATNGNAVETQPATPWQALAIERAETIADLRRRLDTAEARLDRLMLPDQRPARRPWWRRLRAGT